VPLVTSVVVVLVGLVVTQYATLKLVKWSLNVEQEAIRQAHVSHAYSLFKLSLLTTLVIEFGGDIGRWLGSVWSLGAGVISNI